MTGLSTRSNAPAPIRRSSQLISDMLPANGVAAVVGAAATLEVGTAAVLIVDPSLFSWLLFSASMTPAGYALGRISGVALLSLAIACWPRSKRSEAPLAAVRALLLFSALTAACLLDLGIRGNLIGSLLWPAAATHFAFAILLALIWGESRRIAARPEMALDHRNDFELRDVV